MRENLICTVPGKFCTVHLGVQKFWTFFIYKTYENLLLYLILTC